MAGFPHYALEENLKLVELGVRAAVCEQMEDPRFAKGVVKRDIVRVVTPGTLTEDNFLDPRSANHLAAIVEVRGKLGLAWVELSTGRFSLTCVTRTDRSTRSPGSTPRKSSSPRRRRRPLGPRAPGVVDPAVTPRPSWDFVAEQARKVLNEQFGTTTLAGFGVDDDCPEVQAAGALVAYLRDTQKSAIAHIARLTPYHRGTSSGSTR